jgi:hypothetical protein
MIHIVKNILKKAIPIKFLEQPGKFVKSNTNEILALKDKFKGQRCFILGNGPSLNKMDLTKLKDEFSFAVNGIFYKTDEMGYRPTFYVVEDRYVMADNIARINEYICDYKFFPSSYKKQVTNFKNVLFFNMDVGFYVDRSAFFEKSRFSKDCEKVIYCGQSVTFINLQLAYYLGFSEVYLIGMDFEYKIRESDISIKGAVLESTEDDENHFHPDYFGKGKCWHDPKLHNVLKSYELHKSIFEADNRKIYNATEGGKLELFERVSFDQLFKEK